MTKGIKSILLATFLFAEMNVFVKLLSHLPAVELTFFRSIFTFIACYFLIKHKGISLLGSRRPILFLRGIFGSVSLILFFKSIHLLPLATATLIHYITPFFTTFFGFWFLGEKFYKIQWLFLLLCFSGILITQSSGSGLREFNDSTLGLMAALGATVASAAAYNCIRKIGVSEDPNVILIYFSFITIPVSIIFLMITGGFIWPSPMDWFYIFCMGALTQAAQFFMTTAYQNDKVAVIALFSNIGIVYAIANGALIFNEIPTPRAWTGIIIVIAALVMNMFYAKILGFLKMQFAKKTAKG